MIELFDEDLKIFEGRSSNGNQFKWQKSNIWYKADYTGYEGLSEYVISTLLPYTGLKKDEYIKYSPVEIKYHSLIFKGAKSENFLLDDWQIITLERLFKNYLGKSLHEAIWTIPNTMDRLKYLVNKTIEITKIKDFGKYMNKLLTIDSFFLNEDRHTHNIAVLMNSKKEFKLCPIFDNGAGLLSNATLDYPLNEDLYKQMDKVKAKTISKDFEDALNVSKILYGMNMKFTFTKKDVERILALDGTNNEASIYPIEVRERVKNIIFEQMRKYPYLF